MKKTFLALSAAAIACCTLAYATSGNGTSARSTAPVANSASKVASNPDVGVSFGTVDAQLYSESGLSLSGFSSRDYVAKLSESTYMGFELLTGINIRDTQTGELIYDENGKGARVVRLNTDETSITIPDSIKIDGVRYPVTQLYGYDNGFYNGLRNVKDITVPSTITYVCLYNYYKDIKLDGLYMLGYAPEYDVNSIVENVYVCNKQYISGYINNSSYLNNSKIKPYGWDFEWVTVDVEKEGEFAETYLTQNNFDWSAAQYVKVIGNINNVDLSAIKKLTALLKLDLRETEITELPADFMYNRYSLEEVYLPKTIKNIGSGAFYGCNHLCKFDLNGIEKIENSVFSGCSSLPYINLKGVSSIGSYAFLNCYSLSNIDLSSVKVIGYESFRNCTNIDTINLESAVTIGQYAFYNCSKLDSVQFSKSLDSMGIHCFRYTAIHSLELPESLKEIPAYAFAECKNLINVTLSSTVSIGSCAFYGCDILSEVSLNSGLVSIYDRAFHRCGSLENISIPSTVNKIGEGAFNETNIKMFKCYAAVPPAADRSFIGSGMDMSRTYLYIPPFSKDFYRNTDYWCDFNLMKSIDEQVDYILVDRPLTINLEEEDNAVVANNPKIDLTWGNGDNSYIGQLTAKGDGTLSAGHFTLTAQMTNRYDNGYSVSSYLKCPTLINYADKMRADNVSHTFSFYSRYSSPSQWHFISLPYDVKVSDIIPNDETYWVIRRYDSAARAAGETSSTWIDMTNDDTLEAGKGYIVSAVNNSKDENNNRVYPTLTFTSGNSITKNNLFRPTDVIVTLNEYAAEFAHNRSWNLIGNPYPCYFDMHYLNEDFTAPITIWNGKSYEAYSPVDDDLVLAPYKAFFVQCPLDVAEMVFKEAGRLHSDDGKPLFKVSNVNGETVAVEDRNVFNFIIANESYSDRTRIVLNPDAKSEYEIGRDAAKFFADGNEYAQIYVNSDADYSICERPVNDGIAFLGLRSATEKTYTMSLGGRHSNEWHVMLTDNLNGITVDLTKQDYDFSASANDDENRFTVRFTFEGTGVDTVANDFGVDATVTVTSINGVVVFAGRLSDIKVPASGIYMISDGVRTRKAILK